MQRQVLTSVLVAAALFVGAACARAESINPPTKSQISPAMTTRERANLDFVLEWWRIVLQGGRLDRAPRYQAEDYIQHTPNVPTGRAAFIDFARNVLRREPAPTIPAWLDPAPVFAGAKGDFVFLIFERETADPNDPARTYRYNSFEMLRIERGKIQEHWDSYKRVPWPPGSPPLPPAWRNAGDRLLEIVRAVEQPASQAARGDTGRLSAIEVENLATVTTFLKDAHQYGHLDLAAGVLDPAYIEHNPRAPQGRDAYFAHLRATARAAPREIAPHWPDPPSLTLVSGPYVWMMWDRVGNDPLDQTRQYSWSHFDVFRVENGLIKEHWTEITLGPE
ncbi:MAG: nuclear transport factor 2 family protein [Hyphomonadaceae bacterium]|nr:nuclear transport factor 2 family protein [Hyphomonadaceae bacterium]